MTHSYRPVVFTAGGEDGVCGGRHFESRPHPQGGFLVMDKSTGMTFRAANLGEIRVGCESVVNGSFWLSPLERECQLTGEPYDSVMYDCRTPHGWANIGQNAFVAMKCRLGTGLGQKYSKTSDGRWVKVEG